MNLSAPKQMTFIVAVVLAVVGFLGLIIQLGDWSLWLMPLGFVILAAGCFVPNL